MNYSPDLTSAAVKMVLSLGVVLFIVWGLYRLAKTKLPTLSMGGKRKFIQIIDSQYVGVKKSVAMVQVPGSVLVLGIGSDNVNLLTQINDPEILNDIKTASGRQRSLSFRDQLQRFTQPQNKRQSNIHEETVVK
jgi:flagellar biogenesis protein FliO